MKSIKFTVVCCVAIVFITTAFAQNERNYEPIPDYIPTDEVIESKIGALDLPNGYPTAKTAQMLEDELLYVHAIEAYVNTIQAVSQWAIYKGFVEAGVGDNEFLVWPEMMDAKALLLTANMDTYYYLAYINLENGPLVVETPPDALGVMDDMWFRWVSDFGLPGADRGEGGRYLLVPEWYEGQLPEGGYFIRYSKTNRVLVAGRAFLEDNSPAKAIREAEESLKVYPYSPGGQGTSIGSYLNGEARLGKLSVPKKGRMVDATGMSINTLPPAYFKHYVMLNELIQTEPAESLDPVIGGLCEAIGIVKGKEFKPDAHTKAILDKAILVANAYSRTAATGALPGDGFGYYGKGSHWWNPLFDGGYTWTTPPPDINADGSITPYEYKGARMINNSIAFFYSATGITPAMCMRLTGIGSQYLYNNVDSKGIPLNGSNTYKLVLPAGIPAERFWSLTVYDIQTRSIIQTNQRFPRVGSQSFPSPAGEPNKDGSYTIYYGPQKPDRVADSNFILTNPGDGWFQLLRCYSPSKGFFDKTWQPGEMELVK